MPSLRRSFSSPSVRSNPYPTSLSNGSVSNARPRVAGHGFRRSSDSETTERRVLADIEWWRVSDGQCDLNTVQDQAEPDQDVQDGVYVSAGGAITLSASDSPQTPPLMLHDLPPIDFAQSIPMSQFAALSIAPHSPTSRRHGRNSSFSSLESTPEMPETPLESICFSMIDVDAGSHDLQLPSEFALPPTSVISRPSFALFEMCTYSFADSRDFGGDVHQFADGASSFSLDQNIFH
ncbi:hypothetical protein DEU56DRAFT_906087 [Suillus clintonianus]|uniref:uncharacterized protein n=1 Tax=Suillus clintonianus TaxID=1904413 RepID=UPI001B85CE88|nr:uncharacterized protein DEU56DRAFT_906087 [Suillus clintonianus]KAG2157444.1 hypothetical protein DEU56DRAFT_906087 [Suillus clintonianus]